MKMILILMIFTYVQAYETDYEKLASSKEAFKNSKHIMSASKLDKEASKYKNYIEIIHHKVTQTELNRFSTLYKLKLHKCIAKKICIYNYEGNQNIDMLIKKIKDDEDVKAVYHYVKQNMQTF